MELFRDRQQELRIGLILVSHDLALTARYPDRLAVMYVGRIVESGFTDEVFGSPPMPYTQGLLESIPRRGAARHEKLPTIVGSPPDSLEVSPGCAFQPRCPCADDRCIWEQPELVAADGDRLFACWYSLAVGLPSLPHV
jgi:oligopeptide/dipeptide ABC transporter ATP-binding protein